VSLKRHYLAFEALSWLLKQTTEQTKFLVIHIARKKEKRQFVDFFFHCLETTQIKQT